MTKANIEMKRLLALIATAVALCAPLCLAAQSLQEIRARENEDKALDREIAYTRSVCDSSISASIDWRSTASWPEGKSLVAPCDGALGALEAVCRSKDGASKAKRINRFICAGDGSGASLRGGTLRYGAQPGRNGFAETKAVLDREL